jgi:glucose dehydrogenase
MNRKRYGALIVLAFVLTLQVDGLDAQRADDLSFETWNQYLGGSDSSQYSSLDQINRSNVDDLEIAWTYPVGDGNSTFGPTVVDDVMYVVAKDRNIVALNAATGEELWTHVLEGSISSRGINYWESDDGSDSRLVFLSSGFITQVDATTGETVTSFGENGRVDLRLGFEDELMPANPLNTNNPGRIFEDLIIMATPAAGASFNANPADIHAYDVRTGDLEWVFHTLPRPGEFGSETWTNRDEMIGGGHNWSEMTVDPDRGIVFIPTGTARFDFYGANRTGQNLFANSIVALDARTGERIWHFQTVHHDLWDYDLPNAPKLLTVRQNGEEIPAVAQASKHGFLFVFNRETGEPLWPIEERPVPQSDIPGEETWPTQPFPTAPPPFARQSFTVDDINPFLPEEDQADLRERFETYRNEGLFTPPSFEGTIQLPGHNGGANWGSSAVNPERGLMFVSSKVLPTVLAIREPGAGRGGRGGGRGGPPPEPPNAGPDFVAYNSPYNFMTETNGMPAIGPPWSQLTAYDLNKGTILWQINNGSVNGIDAEDSGSHMPRGAPVATAGGLLFQGTSSDRMIRAYDQDTAEILWERQMEAAVEGIPAVYEVDGRQYITFPVASGNGSFGLRIGQPDPAPGQYVTFALPE